MKIARIALTATILFSLKSTLFCSAVSNELTSPIVRKKSFDATRDSNLLTEAARIQWALDHDGQEYTHWRTECQVRPGSDSGAQARWEHVGKTGITTLENAKKFIALVNRHDISLSVKAIQPAVDLIEAERQASIANLHAQFSSLSDQIDTQIATSHKVLQESITYKADKTAFYDLKIQQIIQDKKDDFAAHDKKTAGALAVIIQEIQTISAQADSAKQVCNSNYADAPIQSKIRISASDAKSLNAEKLRIIGEKYNRWTQDNN